MIKEKSFILLESPFESHYRFIDTFLESINSFPMNHKDKDNVYKLCVELIENFAALNKKLIESNSVMTPASIISSTTYFVKTKLEEFSTHYLRDKILHKSEFYVPPEERAIGTRLEMMHDKPNQIEKPVLIQSTLQYISILSTLQKFFMKQSNREVYLNYQDNHQCVGGTYERFCCGELFHSNNFFRENKNALQIQLSTDDFEVCNPLGSKKGVHKVNGLYFVINNMPAKFNSKLRNIYTVAISNANDLDTIKTDVNNMWEMVVSEISHLENVGLDIGAGVTIKGTLVNLVADNLGANTSLCLTKSFSANYFCRICLLSNKECKVITADNPSKYRNTKHYNDILNLIDETQNMSLKETYGVKSYCVLNDLKYFDIFANCSVDIMHDLYEGVIYHSLYQLFSFCLNEKLFKEAELEDFIKYFSYPKKYRCDKPSILRLKGKNMGQNAVQMKCLLLNIPFILHKFKSNSKLKSIWICVTSFINIFQLVHTEKINDSLLLVLTEQISVHLESMKKHFNISLTPKHHFMIHYPHVIRQMGPLFLMSMIRYEAKHKIFKNIAKKTHNFININKTLVASHQEMMCTEKNTYCDEVTHSKLKQIDITDIENQFGEILNLKEIFFSNVYDMSWVKLNLFRYESGSIIVHNSNLFEIKKVLYHQEFYYFICSKLMNLGIDEFSRSLKINVKIPLEFEVIKFDDLLHHKSYSEKNIENNRFVIVDNYDIINILNE